MIRLTAVIEVEGQAPRALTHESNARSIILGRDESADFQLPLSTISRRHARIYESDGVYFIEDLGSTHGTIVNGRKSASGEKKVLRNGDIIELTKAKVTCAIETDKVAMAEPGEGTQAIAARAVQGILGRLGEAQSEGPFFRVLCGPDEGTRFSMVGSTTEWALGRSRDCEFVLNDPNVSRRHAVVRKDWSGFLVEDLGSKNGVLVNDKHIRKPRRLRDRDEIIIGPVKLVFIDPDAELLAALKDVPGFAVDPASEVDVDEGPDAADGGSPEQRDGSGALQDGNREGDGPEHAMLPPSDDEGAAQAAQAAAKAAADADDAALEAIDPELLRTPSGKSPFEWVLIGGVGMVIVASVLLLFHLLV